MKLTIYTVVTYDYFYFAEVFVSSLKENYPDEKLNKIIINELGLSDQQRLDLQKMHNKVEYIKTTEEEIRTQNIHSESWRKAVNQKTLGLEKICKKENYPILMLDLDMQVLSDFSDEIFDNCDIQVCSRPTSVNRDGYLLDHIGCWFVIHNDTGKLFLDSWKKNIPNIISGPVETPALCATIKQNEHNITIKTNHAKIVANINRNPDAKILHFKSTGAKMSVATRVKNLRGEQHELQ